jgi:capsule polysaccharide modification protein KpsS
MNINLSLSSDKYISDIIIFNEKIIKEWKHNVKLFVFIDEIYNPITYKLDFVYSIKNKNFNKVIDLNSAYKIINEYSNIVDTNLYKSDLRFYSGDLREEELILKQANLTNLINTKTTHDDFLSFCLGGTNLIHSILLKISKSKEIFTYRIHNAINLEQGFMNNRIWFSPNNEMFLSKKQELFNHNKILIKEKVDKFLDNLIYGTKRETLSKNFISRRYPNSLSSIFQEFLKLIYLFFTFDKRYIKYYIRFKTLINSKLISLLHTNIKTINKPYILFALNIPTDSQILVRASYFKDFISLISIVADSIPLNHYLIIREHPAFPGMLNFKDLKRLLHKKKQIKLISHSESFVELIQKSKSVLIINNTSYLEAIICGKPVISIGRGVFTSQNITYEVSDFFNLANMFTVELKETNLNKLKSFLFDWYLETYPEINSNNVVFKEKNEILLNGIFEKIQLHYK